MDPILGQENPPLEGGQGEAVQVEIPSGEAGNLPVGEADRPATPEPGPESPSEPILQEQPEGVSRNAQPVLVTRSQALGMIAGASLVTFFLTTFFILFLLIVANGGIRYARSAQLSFLQARVEGLSDQGDALQAAVDEMQTRLQELEDLSSRLETLEAETNRLDGEVSAAASDASARFDDIQENLDRVTLQVDAALTRIGRFQKFLEGLGDLLNTLDQPQSAPEVP